MKCIQKCPQTSRLLFLPVHLLSKIVQSRWILWNSTVSINLHLLAGEDVAVHKELTHELLPIIYIQVAVALERVAKRAALCHGGLHASHEEMTHFCELSHVLHISLRGTVHKPEVTCV